MGLGQICQQSARFYKEVDAQILLHFSLREFSSSLAEVKMTPQKAFGFCFLIISGNVLPVICCLTIRLKCCDRSKNPENNENMEV